MRPRRRPAVPSGRTVFASRPGSVPIRALCSRRRYLLPRLLIRLLMLLQLFCFFFVVSSRLLRPRRRHPNRLLLVVLLRRFARPVVKEVSFRSDHVKKRAVRVAFKLRLGRYLRSSFPPLSLLLTSSSSSSVVSSSKSRFRRRFAFPAADRGMCSSTKSATFSPSLFGEKQPRSTTTTTTTTTTTSLRVKTKTR